MNEVTRHDPYKIVGYLKPYEQLMKEYPDQFSFLPSGEGFSFGIHHHIFELYSKLSGTNKYTFKRNPIYKHYLIKFKDSSYFTPYYNPADAHLYYGYAVTINMIIPIKVFYRLNLLLK